eukprot:c14938_g1_i3.p1 GENE.c14938_g1_i3~~c14938_g1_i3.p1  ORF type:complete len:524 (+),score=118.37 c14938_g1_i3:49-1620(+)
MRLFLFALVGLCAAQDFDEHFTIFIDLDDFHVTQADNHEFLSSDAIGEHDNVVLHLTEDQVKHHLKIHDTFDCNPPQEVHEVVSFIQEKMYERPANPNFVDDAIESNYIQNGVWEKLQQSQPAFPNVLMPYPQYLAATPKPIPQQVQAEPLPKQVQAAAAASTNSDEEEAVSRFRDAYRAYKLLNHAVEGLPQLTTPLSGQGAASSSIFDSLMDDDDKKLFGMFSNQFHSQQPEAESPLSKIVDDAIAGLTEQYPELNVPVVEPQPEPETHHHHHHHHHKDTATAQVVEAQQPVAQPQAPAVEVAPQVVPAPAPAPVVEVAPIQAIPVAAPASVEAPAAPVQIDGIELTEAEKSALLKLAKKLAINGAQAPAKTAPAIPEKILQTPEVSTQVPVQTVSSSDVSHIGKAPSASDFIPENVYAQETVPFTEPPQMMPKHIPKRILIPRMEEPGPVIGGGSRPVHIQLPPIDDAPFVGSSRPAPPSQVQLQVGSSIETSSQTESTKPSSVASSNDEALTAPEVVIF